MKAKKALQRLSDEQLEHWKSRSPSEILDFLESYQMALALADSAPQKLISMRVPESLLRAFQAKARAQNEPYQAVIKRLMRQWLSGTEC